MLKATTRGQGQPSNVTVFEQKTFTLIVDIGDTLDDQAIGPDDVVYVQLRSRALNREMTPIRLSYTAIHRLTTDA